MGFGTFYSAYKLIDGCVVFKVNWLLAFKMNRQSYNRQKFFINREFKQLDDDLSKIDIISLQIYLDFVQPVLPPYFNCCFIKSFVNIFVDIFYNLNYNINLDINMSIVFIDEIQIVKDNKMVIKTDLLSTDNTDHKLAVIISAIN